VLWPLLIIILKPIYEFFFGKTISKKTNTACCSKEDSSTINSSTTINPTTISNENTNKSSYGNVLAITSETEYYEYIKSSNITIVKHSADWCVPCKKIQNFYHDLSQKFPTINFITLDVDQFDQIAAENGAFKIPYFVAFRNGQKVDSIGSSNTVQINAFLNKVSN
jgi:thioredoxin 1